MAELIDLWRTIIVPTETAISIAVAIITLVIAAVQIRRQTHQ